MTAYYSETDPFWGTTNLNGQLGWPNAIGGDAGVVNGAPWDVVSGVVLTGPGTLTVHWFGAAARLSVDAVQVETLTGPAWPSNDTATEYPIEIAAGAHTVRIFRNEGDSATTAGFDGGDWTNPDRPHARRRPPYRGPRVRQPRPLKMGF